MDHRQQHDEILRAFNETCVIATRTLYRGRGFRPAADAFYEEDTGQIVVRFELPGLTLDDIELLVERRELVVRGERPFPNRENRVYQQVEMDYGPFERRLRLMVDVDPEATQATYEAGILEVRLSLAQREGGPRRIPIQTEGEAE